MAFDDPTLGASEFFQDIRESAPDLVTDVLQLLSNTAVYMLIPIGLAAFLLWFRDRRRGDMIMVSILTAVNLNRFFKNVIAEPRPWVRDPSLVPADGTNHSAGYSFPSGHCTAAAAGWGSVAWSAGKRAVTVTAAVLILTIAFARMYVGVHTPLDVVTGLLLGTAVLFFNVGLLSLSDRSDEDFRRISFLYMGVFLPICIVTAVLEDYDMGRALLGISMFYGYFIGRHIERLYRPAGVCGCDLPHALLFYILGLLPVGLAVLLLPLIQEEIGMAAAGLFAGLWISLLYPHVLKRYVCGN